MKALTSEPSPTGEYLIRKNGKYMKGHSYATAFGYSFHWTDDAEKARRFFGGEGSLVGLAQNSGGKIYEAPDRHSPEEWGPSDARRLTCSCGDPDPNHMNPNAGDQPQR